MQDRERSPAAGRHRDAVARENLHVLGDHLGVVEIGLNPGNARDETVDFVLAEAGVFEGEFRGFDVKLGSAETRDDADFGIRWRRRSRPCSSAIP